jgi:hypothetical protein
LENKSQKPDPETEVSINTVDITDLEIAEKIIRKFESKLYTYGVNVQVIYKEINELKQKQKLPLALFFLSRRLDNSSYPECNFPQPK